MKQLFIDAQVFQTPAWDRGMGKYSLDLIAALLEENRAKRQWQKIHLILSRDFETGDDITSVLLEKLSGIEIHRLPLKPNKIDNLPVAEENRHAINSFIKDRLPNGQQADFLIMSLLQSEIAPAFPSMRDCRKLVIFYDIIPLMFHEIYLSDPAAHKGYFSKFAELLRADEYLTISKTVANDLSFFLGVDKNRIHNIDGGAVKHSEEQEEYPVKKPFILMPTGNDVRKNNKRAIQGFELFNRKHNNAYTLVITSSFLDHEIKELKKHSKHIVFTGNIKGSELAHLYAESEGLLFPSEYEGLGMPIIEALEKNKSVACSDIAVFREISSKAFYFFNPFEPSSIAGSLEEMIIKASKRHDKSEIRSILNRYTWQQCARNLMRVTNKRPSVPQQTLKKELSLLSGDPESSLSGMFVQLLHSELHRLANPAYYFLYIHSQTSSSPPRINYLRFIANTHSIKMLQPYVRNKLVVHILSGDTQPLLLSTALGVPGVLILLDTDLEKLWKRSVEQGYISHSRYLAEKGVGKNQFYVSLIHHHRLVIVHDKQMQRVLEECKKSHDLKTEIKYLDPPAPELVYPELVSKARSKVAIADNSSYSVRLVSEAAQKQKLPATSTDRQVYESLQSAEELYLGGDISRAAKLILATHATEMATKTFVIDGEVDIKNLSSMAKTSVIQKGVSIHQYVTSLLGLIERNGHKG